MLSYTLGRLIPYPSGFDPSTAKFTPPTTPVVAVKEPAAAPPADTGGGDAGGDADMPIYKQPWFIPAAVAGALVLVLVLMPRAKAAPSSEA